MINTPWHAKIEAQQLFYFTILQVGETLMDLAVSMMSRLNLYTDANGTLIFDKYKECSPKNHERTAEVGAIGYNSNLQMLLLRWEVIVKNKNN